MSILELLGLKRATEEREHPESADTHTVRKIVEQLDDLPAERARFVASFAFVLSRVARADMDICKNEKRLMERIVMEIGGLPEEQAIIVIQMAKTQALLFGGTENYLVTREFGQLASRAEKLRLLECLFAVSAADHSITENESRTIRQIADELLLEHADYVRVRSQFKEHLAVLQRAGDS